MGLTIRMPLFLMALSVDKLVKYFFTTATNILFHDNWLSFFYLSYFMIICWLFAFDRQLYLKEFWIDFLNV